MIRWIEWHFHDRVDYNAVLFLTELLTSMGSHIFGILGVRKFEESEDFKTGSSLL